MLSTTTRAARLCLYSHHLYAAAPIAPARVATVPAVCHHSHHPLMPTRRSLSSTSSPHSRSLRIPALLLGSRIATVPGLSFVGLSSQRRNLSLWPTSSKTEEVESTLRSAEETVVGHAQETTERVKEASQQASEQASNVANHTSERIGDAASRARDAVQNTAHDLSNEASHLAHETSEIAAASSSDLAAYGLGHQGDSYAPVRYAQELLNMAVETTGLPWWATIALLTITIRLLVAPVLIWAQSNGIRMANIQPQMQAGMKELQEAKSVGDQMEMQRAAMKVRKLMKDNDVSILRNFAVPAIQMPVFVTLFFALRGMANAGLPSMQHGGLAWFTDLTTNDPYLVLPILSAVMTLGIVESGAETGGSSQMSGNVKNFIRVLIVGSLFFMYKFPAAVFVFWSVNNTFSLLQLLFLKTPFARRVLKVPARITPPKPTGPPQSFMDSVRAGYNSQVTPAPGAASSASARTVDAGREEALRKLTGSASGGASAPGPIAQAASAALKSTINASGAQSQRNKGAQGKKQHNNVNSNSKGKTASAPKSKGGEPSGAVSAHKRKKEERVQNARARRAGGSQ